jgi:hypothetical protein
MGRSHGDVTAYLQERTTETAAEAVAWTAGTAT